MLPGYSLPLPTLNISHLYVIHIYILKSMVHYSFVCMWCCNIYYMWGEELTTSRFYLTEAVKNYTTVEFDYRFVNQREFFICGFHAFRWSCVLFLIWKSLTVIIFFTYWDSLVVLLVAYCLVFFLIYYRRNFKK